jgi:hypothetical protein
VFRSAANVEENLSLKDSTAYNRLSQLIEETLSLKNSTAYNRVSQLRVRGKFELKSFCRL